MNRFNRREVLHGSSAFIVGAALGHCDGATTQHPAASWAWAGGVTGRRATVKAKLRFGSDPYLWVSPLHDPLAARELTAPRVGPHGVARFELEGLRPDTDYLYAARDRGASGEVLGRFRTFPEGPASFSFCAASCARTGSNHRVFDTIAARDPLFFLHLGDFHYLDIPDNDPARFAAGFDRVLSAPRQAELYRSRAFAYVWDDHDYGPNNSDRESRSRIAALRAYAEHVPSYPLVSDPPVTIHQAFTVGRVRFLLTDLRAARDPQRVPEAERSMLGAQQKAWLLDELGRADEYALVVWASSVGWISDDGDDNWNAYPAERREIAEFIAERGIENLLAVCGDAHMLAIDDGGNNRYAADRPGFPVFQCAALDQRGSDKGGPFSHPASPGGGQFGEIVVGDEGGDTVQVELRGRDADDRVVMRHAFSVTVPSGAG